MRGNLVLSIGLLAAAAPGFAADGPRPPTPTGNPGSWVTTADYPGEALRKGIDGTADFRVTIDRTGRVSSCEITTSTGSALLDSKTCELVKLRARFTVPLDENGSPTTGTYSNRVRWAIPSGEPMEGVAGVSFVLEPDGTRSDCRILSSDDPRGALIARTVPCKEGETQAPVRDGNGVAQRKRITVLRTITIEDVR